MTRERFDVVVVGAGAVGLAAALAFSRAGFSTSLIGPVAGQRDGRTAALLDGSLSFLGTLGIGSEVDRASAPLRTMRIIDDTGSLFRPPPVSFAAAEIGLDAFGRNIENATLTALLADAAHGDGRLAWSSEFAAGLEGGDLGGVRLAGGALHEAALVVAADGRKSRLREAAGIPVRDRRYPQAALTTTLRHTRPHGNTSTEFHTKTGPFTLVPLPGIRSSLVWVERPERANELASLADADLERAIERMSRSLLGKFSLDGKRGVVPLGMLSVDRLFSRRLALVGEAAHALPPIGAQGLNLGLADVGALVEAATRARERGEDIGGKEALRRYERARLPDVRLRSYAVDGLNRALLSDLAPVDGLRGLGLGALARIGPLRRAVMRAGLTAGVSARTG